MPPSINNGKWHCNDTSKLKTCTIECDPGYFVMGLKSVSCSINDGWFNKENWLEFPLCLGKKILLIKIKYLIFTKKLLPIHTCSHTHTHTHIHTHARARTHIHTHEHILKNRSFLM